MALPIPAASGLVEEVHVVFFPDAIVGSIFNFYGPRLSTFGRYLSSKCPDECSDVVFAPLLRQDVVEQLGRLRDIRLFQLRVPRPHAHIVTEANEDLGAAFDAAARISGADEVEVIARLTPRSRRSLSNRLLGLVRDLAGRPDVQETTSRFIVKGFDEETQRVEEIDVLSDQLIAKRRVLVEDERTRALDRQSAYAAVEEAHRELRPLLRDAAGLPPQ